MSIFKSDPQSALTLAFFSYILTVIGRPCKPMPPGYVKIIREEILYEYAKLISRSAHGSIQYPFVADRFKKLRDGQITISGTIREPHDLQSHAAKCGIAP